MTQPEIALTLGAGSARGLAHIGVLQALEANGLRPDLIVGCSMGAVVGAVYAAGTDLFLLERLVCHLDYPALVDPHLLGWGLVIGKKFEELLNLLTKRKKFADLTETQFVAVATDLVTRRLVTIEEGTLTAAARASSSIPGIFEPVRRDGMILVDGALLDRLPVAEAHKRVPRLIIAVDVKSTFGENTVITSMTDVLLNALDIMESQQFQPEKPQADILILPEVHHISPADFRKAGALIVAGRQATQRAMPEILRALGRPVSPRL